MKRYSITDYHKPEMSEDEIGYWVKWEDIEIFIRGLEEQLQLEIDLEFYYTKGRSAINNE